VCSLFCSVRATSPNRTDHRNILCLTANTILQALHHGVPSSLREPQRCLCSQLQLRTFTYIMHWRKAVMLRVRVRRTVHTCSGRIWTSLWCDGQIPTSLRTSPNRTSNKFCYDVLFGVLSTLFCYKCGRVLRQSNISNVRTFEMDVEVTAPN
jgi:hypothetical protein